MYTLDKIRNIVKYKTTCKKNFKKSSAISDNDQGILYYISGIIPKALKKKSQNEKLKIKCTETIMVLKSTSQSASAKYLKCTSKISRGL